MSKFIDWSLPIMQIAAILMIVSFSTFAVSQEVLKSSFIETANIKVNKTDRLIVFVHGLGGNDNIENGTWHAPNGNHWPTIMRKDELFSGFAVYSYVYPTDLFQERLNIQGMADRLINQFTADEFKSFEEIIFIVHSLGGIITRQAILNSSELLDKTKSIFIFGTPMNGGNLSAWAKTFGINV